MKLEEADYHVLAVENQQWFIPKTPSLTNDTLLTYWEAVEKSWGDMHLPTIAEAQKLILSKQLETINYKLNVCGTPLRICWIQGGAALAQADTNGELFIENQASGCGMELPVWLVKETKE